MTQTITVTDLSGCTYHKNTKNYPRTGHRSSNISVSVA